MGGKSTLHKKSVSSDAAIKSDAFDLKSWQGLTSLLKAGKEALEPTAYAEFRNLVLHYAQNGGDPEFKERIDAVVMTFGQKEQKEHKESAPVTAEVIPEVDTLKKITDASVTEVEGVQLSSRRIQPKFGISTSTTLVPKPKPKPEPEPVPEPPVVTPQPESIPLVVEPEPTPKQIAPQVNTSHPVAEQEDITQPPSFTTLEQNKIRISEIKRTVNAHFGNPVALMALPNNLGKTYMTALLNALKVTGSGTPGNVDYAMSELERTYTALLQAEVTPAPVAPIVEIPTQEVEVIVPKPEPEPVIVAPIPEPASTPHVIEPEPIPEPAMLVPSIEKSEVVIEPVAQESSEYGIEKPSQLNEEIKSAPQDGLTETLTPTQIDENEKVLAELRATMDALMTQKSSEDRPYSTQEVPPVEEQIVPTHAEEIQTPLRQREKTTSTIINAMHDELPTPSQPSEEIIDSSESTNSSIIESEKANTASNEKSADGDVTNASQGNQRTKKGLAGMTTVTSLQKQGIDIVDVLVKQTELFTPQVTTMLNKLLHDWSIFSGSGFFGTGPAGAEHPLYITIKDLSMGEVLMGRWNGADPKIIKIIKQYVDAWRHEQGLTFSPTETFDHYLRRVVQRIVKRQNS